MSMTYADTLEELNITLGDTDNVTFTPEEKARALQKAWNDSYVVSYQTGNTLTFATGTRSYALPSGFTTLTEVGISPSNSLSSDFVQWIDSNFWEIQGSNIVFKNNANGVIPGGYTLYIKGKKKLDWNTDTLDTTALQEYVIALAGYNTLTLLSHKKANLFLKNDMTVAELVTLKRDLATDVKELRAKLAGQFEG